MADWLEVVVSRFQMLGWVRTTTFGYVERLTELSAARVGKRPMHFVQITRQ